MPKKMSTLSMVAIAAVLVSPSSAGAASSPTGLWIDQTGRGAVEITECGGALCGHVAWVKDAKDAEGCGLQILGNVKPVGPDKWDNGWIYDPDRDQKFDVELTPLGADKLRVMGYEGTKWLNETMIWKRAPDGLTKCSKPGETAATTPVMEKKAETLRTAETAAATPTAVDKASTTAAPAKEAPAPEMKATSKAVTTGEAKPAGEAKGTSEVIKGLATETKKAAAKKGNDFAGALSQLVEALADSVDDSR